MGISLKTGRGKLSFLNIFPVPKFLAMSAVGIDISDNSLKLVEFLNTSRGRTLGRVVEKSIPSNIVSKGVILDKGKLIKILQELKNEHKLRYVHVSLPEEKTYLFPAQIPVDVEKDQIRNILEFQLEEHVPIDPKEAIFDCEASGEHASEDEHIDVSVTVYPRKTVRSYVDVFRKAGLEIVSFEIETQAIAKSVIPEGDMGTQMIVDFGKTRTGVAIVSNGVLLFTSTLEVRGQLLTDALKKHFPDKSDSELAAMKNEKGFLEHKDNKELYEELMKVVNDLRDEINRYLVYWQSRKDDRGKPASKVEKIILCGGNANFAGLPEYLSASLKIKIQRANVWVNAFSFEDVIPDIDRPHALAYATAIGLALREVE